MNEVDLTQSSSLTKGYRQEIIGKPDFAYARIQIPANETLMVEASAMATMDTHIQMKTKFKGGFKRFFRGESLFINEFTAKGAPGQIEIAPGPPGDLQHTYLDNQSVFLQASCYVASSGSVESFTKWDGMLKGFFSGMGLFLIKCSGTGDLWFNSFGGIFEIDVKGETVVDNGHIVGFTEGLEYEIGRIGGFKSFFLSGEALVCKFRGEGKVWVQNRQIPSFVGWINPYRRVQRNNYN
ncbi:MAG: TIGR00266 family protein [Bdellovibrionales bacterium]|nr:TIGR00266 family protein [Bdellovibrionales bacterium]